MKFGNSLFARIISIHALRKESDLAYRRAGGRP